MQINDSIACEEATISLHILRIQQGKNEYHKLTGGISSQIGNKKSRPSVKDVNKCIQDKLKFHDERHYELHPLCHANGCDCQYVLAIASQGRKPRSLGITREKTWCLHSLCRPKFLALNCYKFFKKNSIK